MEHYSQEPEKKLTFNLAEFLSEIFNIKDEVDKNLTKERIKNSISFRGLSSYILIASVMVASIGLNANSAAVVIGAMLISPLMGPIVGLGYSVAVNDFLTLKRSISNFGIMVVIALLTSYIYFSLFPSTINEQLKGRIEPTLLDVMIAFFGGLAGIVASSSKNTNVNAVAGVAIATALMPPLCTVGFGLAMGTESIDLGFKSISGYQAALTSFYLFFINSVFISIVTFLFIRLMKFPLAKYQDEKRKKRINTIIISLAVITMIPSAFIFYDVVKESNYLRKVNQFLKEEVNAPGTKIDKEFENYEVVGNNRVIHISAVGEAIPQPMIAQWNQDLKKKYGLDNTEIKVYQGYNGLSVNEFSANVVERLVVDYREEVYKKDSIINDLKLQITKLNSNQTAFLDISNELKSLYKDLDYFGYSVMNYTNFSKNNTIPVFTIGFKKYANLSSSYKANEKEKIKKFLQTRLKIDNLVLIELR